MHVIVVGCGRVGSELATRLVREGHSVAVIDKNESAFRRLPPGLGGRPVVGFGFDQDSLAEAGIAEAGALAAVTSGDNSNILAARIARETFEVERVVARIYDPRRAIIYQRLGIPTVATVSWTVDQVVRRMLPEETATSWTDPTGALSLVEHPLPPSLCGRKLAELEEPNRYRPVFLTRGGEVRLAEPATIGQEGDVVHFVVLAGAVADLEARLAAADAGGEAAPRGAASKGAAGAVSAPGAPASPAGPGGQR